MRRGCLLVALLFVACVDDDGAGEETGPPMEEFEAGDPCGWPDALCANAEEVMRCVDRRWVVDSCAEFCGALAPGVTSTGCVIEFGSSTPEHLCACEPPPGGCAPGEGSCEGDDTLAWCTQDWAWTSHSCDTLCAADGLLSAGCEAIGDQAACLCTKVGTSCVDEPATCIDLGRLATCEAGVWVEVDCVEQCGAGGSCEPGAQAGASCGC